MHVGFEEAAKDTIKIVHGTRELMATDKEKMRTQHEKVYSKDFLNNLFKHPYTKIKFVEADLKVTRQTAANYLDDLAESGLLIKQKIGRHNFSSNEALFNLFLQH